MDNSEAVIKKIIDNKAYISIVKRGERVQIPVELITYIESNAHRIIIHTADKECDYYDKMDNILALLKSDGYIRCHQSYSIKTSLITSVRGDKLYAAGIQPALDLYERKI